jgi:monosaccharide-transporting ATPase
MERAASGRDPVLTVRGLSKTYPGVRALDGFTLTLRPDEVHGLTGVNGAGKSTVIKILSGVVSPTTGTVEITGHGVVAIETPADAQRYGIAVVHQELPLLPNLTAAENIALGLEPGRVVSPAATRAAERRYRAIAERFPGAPPANARLSELGLYAWQIVAIIRALSTNARILILDEPTSSLSTTERTALHELLEDVSTDGIAVLYVSHFLDDILEAAQNVSVVRDGRLVHCGPASELDGTSLLAHMTGGGASQAPVARRSAARVVDAEPERTGLVVTGLRSGRLRPTSFEARRGERLGMYGLEDSGARIALEAIFGLRRRAGRVEWNGQAVGQSTRRAIDAGIALVTGDRKRALLPDWSVALNHALPRLCERPLFARMPTASAGSSAGASIERLAIKATPEQLIGALSGGNQQKVLLGRWMDRSGMCLLLDEPTRGVDLDGRTAIHDQLRALADQGTTLVVHSTDPEEIAALCQRVLVFATGQIVGELRGSEVTADGLEQLTRDRSLHRIAA